MREFCDCTYFEGTPVDQNSAKTRGKLIKYFKSLLFSVIVLVEPVSLYLQSSLLTHTISSISKIESIIPLIELPLSIYFNLNIITHLSGMRSFGTLEKQMTIFSASLVKISIFDPTHIQVHMRFIESMHSNVLETPASLLDFCKLNFYIFLASKMVHFLENSYLEGKVLLIANKNLILLDDPLSPLGAVKSDTRDLCHMIWTKIFSSSILHQNTIRILGKEYALTLFDMVHNGIDLKLAEEQFSIILRGLCDFSPAKEHPLVFSADLMNFFSSSLSSNNNSVNSLPIPVITLQQKDEWLEEADNFSWDVVLELIDRIEKHHKVNSKLISSKSSLISNSVLAQEINRTSLCTILFHAIGTISLKRLDILLELIEGILVGQPSLKSDEQNSSDISNNRPTLGIVRDLDSSLIWRRLFKLISEPNSIDYSRRQKCVLWYIQIFDKAKKRGAYYSRNGRSVKATDLVLPKAKL